MTAIAIRPAMSFARIGFLNMLAYRARYYVGVLTYLFNVAVYYFIWRAVFRHSPTVMDHLTQTSNPVGYRQHRPPVPWLCGICPLVAGARRAAAALLPVEIGFA